MEQQVRFCTSADGTRIAYALYAGGPALPVVHLNGFGHVMQTPWTDQTSGQDVDGSVERRTVLTYERRGVGASRCDAARITPEREIEDLAAVVDCAGLETFGILAYDAGIGAGYAAEHPERVAKLVLWAPFVRGSDTMFRDAESMVRVIETNWSIARRAIVTMMFPSGPAERQRQASDTMRDSMPPQVMAELLRLQASTDLTELLPRVQMETLVMQARGQRGLGNINDVLALLPNARLLTIDGDPRSITAAVEQFLDEGRAAPPEPAAAPPVADIVTILFTDITDSTALTQRLGDAKAQELVRAHDTIVREALRAHGGTEIKHTGDGIMASFPSASGALECAVMIQRAVEERNVGAHGNAPLQVHMGVNAGEPVAEEQDLFGTAVQLARRICDQAEGGEILASDVVRQLAAGKGFLFADRGEQALRGFEDAVRLYEVRWREAD